MNPMELSASVQLAHPLQNLVHSCIRICFHAASDRPAALPHIRTFHDQRPIVDVIPILAA